MFDSLTTFLYAPRTRVITSGKCGSWRPSVAKRNNDNDVMTFRCQKLSRFGKVNLEYFKFHSLFFTHCSHFYYV